MNLIKCHWCAKDRRKPSEWEQMGKEGRWLVLCVRCANRRLDNPYNALLAMRRIGTTEEEWETSQEEFLKSLRSLT